MSISEDGLTAKIDEWSIEARAFPIPFTPFCHNFWVLVASNQIVVGQLHGLAVDSETGDIQAVGNSRHLLQVIHHAELLWALRPGQPTAVCAVGAESEISHRWQAALHAIPAINALQLPYPDWWQHAYHANSNTVFNTLGQIMGFGEVKTLLQTLSPGIGSVISQEIIEKYMYVV